MPTLSFKLAGFRTQDFLNLDLPVEVRKPNLALVARTLTTQNVEVKPGTYFVTATLPAGQKLLAEVELKTSDATVELSPESGDMSPHESHEQHHFLGTAFESSAAVASYNETELKSGPRRQKRKVKVSLLSGRDPVDASAVSSARGPSFQTLDSGVQCDYNEVSMYPEVRNYLEVVQPDGSATRVALPASYSKRCFVVLRAISPEVTSTEVHLENVEADLLLRGSQTGRQVSIAKESETMSPRKLLSANSEEMVRQKIADPVAAAVAAYTFLNWGEITSLRPWTENLKNWFTWLPDGLTIRGEHLAQLGKHDDALKNFAALPLRGSPLFRDGLSYAIERLRLYTEAKTTHFSSEVVLKARNVLAWLGPIAAHTDFSQPILTLRGLVPSAETISTTTLELPLEFLGNSKAKSES